MKACNTCKFFGDEWSECQNPRFANHDVVSGIYYEKARRCRDHPDKCGTMGRYHEYRWYRKLWMKLKGWYGSLYR